MKGNHCAVNVHESFVFHCLLFHCKHVHLPTFTLSGLASVEENAPKGNCGTSKLDSNTLSESNIPPEV